MIEKIEDNELIINVKFKNSNLKILNNEGIKNTNINKKEINSKKKMKKAKWSDFCNELFNSRFLELSFIVLILNNMI
jgi:heat shock protein HslJ